jgi:hypothetical protein
MEAILVKFFVVPTVGSDPVQEHSVTTLVVGLVKFWCVQTVVSVIYIIIVYFVGRPPLFIAKVWSLLVSCDL